ncbi:hypothetical protein TREES_T100021059 [Tupaia chinensis]|uniref:Uncharacterized protein n=1 Tax=Tupaia chinensis TaxID=246437 RepID=L9JEP5_TUPCH|nr:hypothetical protein TREES_T100021059 [Tupaia chinensis]
MGCSVPGCPRVYFSRPFSVDLPLPGKSMVRKWKSKRLPTLGGPVVSCGLLWSRLAPPLQLILLSSKAFLCFLFLRDNTQALGSARTLTGQSRFCTWSCSKLVVAVFNANQSFVVTVIAGFPQQSTELTEDGHFWPSAGRSTTERQCSRSFSACVSPSSC